MNSFDSLHHLKPNFRFSKCLGLVYMNANYLILIITYVAVEHGFLYTLKHNTLLKTYI